MGIVIPVIAFVNDTRHVAETYRQNQVNAKRQKLYDVTYFVTKDTLPPIMTDTLRWKRFVLAYTNSAVVYNMQDKANYFQYDLDTIKHTYTLHDNPDTSTWNVFHYLYPKKNLLQLKGSWQGNDVNIFMKEVSIDSMNLNKEKIIFFQD